MTCVHDPVVIVAAARTPLGGFQGALAGFSAPQLGSIAIRGLMERSQMDSALIDEVIMGCVLPAGLGQAPARQAALGAGLPLSVACSCIGKVCGSGMRAVMMGRDMLLAGSARVLIAGGMESMSNAPYLLPKARSGMRLGHGQVVDHMFFDGLEDAYEHGRLMGSFAEDCARQFGFSREAQDAFAATSTRRALDAQASGAFAEEIVPVPLTAKRSANASTSALLSADELPAKVDLARISQLKPAFHAQGTITAANASSIADGAAALLLMRESTAEALHLTPQARVLAQVSHAQEPALFTTAPVSAITKLLGKVGWHRDEVDLWELNEAFAVVTLATMQSLDLDHDKVNIHGGACALGHPIGATGARILVTLLAALQRSGGRRGVASLCIGGGEATAMAIEIC